MPSPTMQARRYFISRVPDANGEIDPTGPLSFFPSKDSDELYEALKEAFPHFRTHKERLREAVIDFHLREREDERAMNSSVSTELDVTPFTIPGSVTPAWVSATPMATQHSQSSFEATPEYLPSPVSLLSNTFPSTPAPEPLPEHVSAVPSSAAASLREMTSVWCVSSDAQPKIRTRRAMTEAEKKEYRKKRMAGACVECKRRRRKCDHGSLEQEGSKHGIKKPAKCSRPKTAAAPPPPPPSSVNSFLEQSSPSQGSLESPLAAAAADPDLPSSILWPASMGSLDFDNMFADFDTSATLDFVDEAPMHDPVFDFIDFSQGSDQFHQALLPVALWNTHPSHNSATSRQLSETRGSQTRLNVEESGALHAVERGSQVLPGSESTENNPRLDAYARVPQPEPHPHTPRQPENPRTEDMSNLNTSTTRSGVLLGSASSDTSLSKKVIATMPRLEPHAHAPSRTERIGVLPRDPHLLITCHQGEPGLPVQDGLPENGSRTAVPGLTAHEKYTVASGERVSPRLPQPQERRIVPAHDGPSASGSYALVSGHSSALPGILPVAFALGTLAVMVNLLPALATLSTACKLAMVWLSLAPIRGERCSPMA